MNSSDNEKENPRTTRVRQVILDAAIELLLSGGGGEVTATRVAEQTNVARTTIYRYWPDQASLLLATIEALITPHSPSPGVGNLEVDLRTSLTELKARLEYRQVRPVFAALIDHSSREEAFVFAQRRFAEGLVRQTIDQLEEAQTRGELPSSLDCSIAAATLAGPILHQFLVMRAEITDELIDETLCQFMGQYGKQ